MFGDKIKQTTLMKHLIKLFSDDFSQYLIYGVKSKEETFFLDILRFYFGCKNVKYGFKLNGKIYDALIFNKILFEYDGSFYHKNKIDNDNLKDKIAIENGYYIYRVDEKSVKDINFLKKISEWENLN